MKDNKKIYISGKITGLSDNEYTKHFENAEKHLEEQGYVPINPSRFVSSKSISYGELLWVDMKAILDCSTIYMLNNWQESKGSTAEYYFAKAVGLNVIFE